MSKSAVTLYCQRAHQSNVNKKRGDSAPSHLVTFTAPFNTDLMKGVTMKGSKFDVNSSIAAPTRRLIMSVILVNH